MEMEKLYGLEQKVEMCPDPSHLELLEMENVHGSGQKLEMCPDPSHLEISKFNKMQICGTYKSGWHGNFFLQTMSE